MTIRQVASLIVTVNAVLFLLGVFWLPILLVVQGLVSVIALGVLYYWIAQLENDFDKEREGSA